MGAPARPPIPDYLVQTGARLLREKGAADVVVFGGGIIPPADIAVVVAVN